MLSTVYQLVRPRQFETAFRQIELDTAHVIVRPTHLSICNADQRYYQGKRSEDILRRKLPMALIHEAVGRVVYDPTGSFAVGEKVVIIPNEPREQSDTIAENYLRSSLFRGSSMDGFMQEYVDTLPDRLVRVPDCLDNDGVTAFSEMVSVCMHAISRFDAQAGSDRRRIGIWGDGNMGYFTALLLRARFPESEICVFGVHENKLNDFSFADRTYLVSRIPEDLVLSHAFECVGGGASGQAINQIIDHIMPEGTIAITGVSEDFVPINTRMVLEKGLRIIGTSRSGRKDFQELMQLYASRPDIAGYLEKMVGAVLPVRSIQDMKNAFEMDIHKIMGKTVMVWDT